MRWTVLFFNEAVLDVDQKRGIHYLLVLTHGLILGNMYHLTLCFSSLLNAQT